MHMVIQGNPSLDIESGSDITRLIPVDVSGNVLNFGQGEGQFELGTTIWGVYITDSGDYKIQYEEGQCEWLQFVELVTKLHQQIKLEFGSHLTIMCQGVFHGQDNI